MNSPLGASPNVPRFHRAMSPGQRLGLATLASVLLLVLDLRFGALGAVRDAVSVVLRPVQEAAHWPVKLAADGSIYFATLAEVQAENARLRRIETEDRLRAATLASLEAENAELRRLLGMGKRAELRTLGVEVLYDAPDPFSRRIVVDRGANAGVRLGLAVLDADGLVGQVTRIQPLVSEVTLITQKDHAVPVMVQRNGVRGVVYGLGDGYLELRHLLADADVRADDLLVTSGLDGVFPAGIPVARVVSVNTGAGFSHIVCEPVALGERRRYLMVVERVPAKEASAGGA